MFVFLWVLGAMGVAYWARLEKRNPTLWFVIAAVLSPLGGSIALYFADRIFSGRRT